jgi:hypothetical protein
MSMTLRVLWLVAMAIAVSCVTAVADEPLRVYSSGAPGAMVYVTPQSAITADASSSSDVGAGAFAGKYFRGKTPLQVDLKPGQYMVSVMPTADNSMRDTMFNAQEFVWDGYDYHAVVDLGNTRWRYAQCYLIEKVKDFPAEVLAVFTDQMPEAQALSFDMGKKATPFTGGVEVAGEILEQAKLPLAYVEDVTRGVQAGMKVLVREGAERWVITADGPSDLKVISAHGSGAWAGRRLSICSSQDDIF